MVETRRLRFVKLYGGNLLGLSKESGWLCLHCNRLAPSIRNDSRLCTLVNASQSLESSSALMKCYFRRNCRDIIALPVFFLCVSFIPFCRLVEREKKEEMVISFLVLLSAVVQNGGKKTTFEWLDYEWLFFLPFCLFPSSSLSSGSRRRRRLCQEECWDISSFFFHHFVFLFLFLFLLSVYVFVVDSNRAREDHMKKPERERVRDLRRIICHVGVS